MCLSEKITKASSAGRRVLCTLILLWLTNRVTRKGSTRTGLKKDAILGVCHADLRGIQHSIYRPTQRQNKLTKKCNLCGGRFEIQETGWVWATEAD
jgi:hypothetical protein